MTDDGDVTVGELFRALGKVEKAVDDGFTKVNGRIDNLRSEFVLKELYESERDALNEKLDKVHSAREDGVSAKRWLVTTCIAGVGTLAGFYSVGFHFIH